MISIIIINYKQKKFSIACIESIYETIRSVPFEIILINNSPEDDFSELSKRFENITVISNENKGYSQANNVGAKNSQYEFLLFLNADTIFVIDPFKDLFRLMDKRNYGAVGLKLFNKDDTFQLSIGIFNSLQGEVENKSCEKYFRQRNLPKMLEIENKYCEIKIVDWVSGAAMFMKKSVFNDIGGFDERFFLYYEDADLCKRLEMKGYHNYFYPFSKIVHYKGENVNAAFDSTYYHSKVSQILFYKLHNNLFNNIVLRAYLFAKFFFLSIATFKKVNFKILKLSISGV